MDTQRYSLWHEARAIHSQRTQKLTEYRIDSLATSHRIRIALLEEQLNQATNEKIQKMCRSQIANAGADYAMRIQELDIALERADIVADQVAYGVIRINSGRQE